MNKANISICVIICIILIQACVGVQPQSQTSRPSSYKYNFASRYNPSSAEIQPEVRIFAKSKTEALVFYKIPTNEIQKTVNTIDDDARLIVKYTLRNADNFAIVDSGTVVNMINLKQTNEEFNSYFTVNTPNQENYKIIISIYGEKANTGKRLLEDIELKQNNEVFFLPKILKKNEEEVLYTNFINSNNTYKLSSNICGPIVKIDYYKITEHVHLPPYYIAPSQNVDATPDSTFTYTLSDSIKFNKKGIYFIREQNQSSGGLCLINIDDYFPEIKTVESMLEPLKLLTTNKEYKEIANSENLKQAIDYFWLTKSQSQKFAKEQIRVFYNRVALANKYFSENKEGWKTDRGMIYIMFGPPSIINISTNQEEWFYGEDPDVAGIFFLFTRTETPSYNKSWILHRDANYQTVWAQALQIWRSGKIFTITN